MVSAYELFIFGFVNLIFKWQPVCCLLFESSFTIAKPLRPLRNSGLYVQT